MFHTLLFADHFANWVDEGEDEKDVVVAFCKQAESTWRLGGEDDIEEAAAYAMGEARTVVHMFTFLANPTVKANTQLSAVQSLGKLLDLAHQTKNCGVTAMCAIAANKSSWDETVRTIKVRFVVAQGRGSENPHTVARVAVRTPSHMQDGRVADTFR